MHVAKFKQGGALQVVRHIERDRPKTATYGNERIDASRTHQNYAVQLRTKQGRAVNCRQYTEALAEARSMHEATTGRQARSDAVSLVCAVVQLPREYCDIRSDEVATAKDAEQAEQFFRAATIATLRHFGVQPKFLVSAEVHLDETTPHIHIVWVPVRGGKLNAKEQVNRSSLKSYHDFVDRFLRESLPWYRGGLVSDSPSERLKSSDNMTMHEVRQAKSQLARVKAKTAVAIRNYAIVEDLPKSEREVYERFLEKRGLTEDFEQYKRDISSVAHVLQSADIRNPNTKGGREL